VNRIRTDGTEQFLSVRIGADAQELGLGVIEAGADPEPHSFVAVAR
jgi:hypothetical protein